MMTGNLNTVGIVGNLYSRKRVYLLAVIQALYLIIINHQIDAQPDWGLELARKGRRGEGPDSGKSTRRLIHPAVNRHFKMVGDWGVLWSVSQPTLSSAVAHCSLLPHLTITKGQLSDIPITVRVTAHCKLH